MGEFDAIGDAVTGALVGRAVEPRAGEAGDGHTHETNCLNCGAPLTGRYCAQCGQRAHIHRSLPAFMGDFVAGVLNFEGKFWRTLPMLAWHPGILTRRYIEGQRARFISPIALFLFSVFLLFATIQLIGGPSGMSELTASDRAYHSTDEAIAGEKAKLQRLLEKRAKSEPDDVGDLDQAIADQRKSIATLESIRKEGVVNAVLAEKSDVQVHSSVPVVNDAIKKAKANPQLALYRLQDAASKYAWVLIPISAPMMWFLFPFSRRFRFYDHTVFVTYSLAFMMLLVIVMSLWGAAGLPGVAFAILVPPVHIYRDLKGAYGLNRFGALWRTALLLLFSVIALSLFAMSVIVLGMSG